MEADPTQSVREGQKTPLDEHAELRVMNLRSALDEYLRRPATSREFEAVQRKMTDPKTGNIEKISREEMLQRIADFAKQLQLSQGPEIHEVHGQAYTPRGNRQTNFESGLAAGLGRDLTPADIQDAERYIDSIPGEREKFNKMVGEEASHYAETVARRILVQRLREDLPDNVSSDDQRMAEK